MVSESAYVVNALGVMGGIAEADGDSGSGEKRNAVGMVMSHVLIC